MCVLKTCKVVSTKNKNSIKMLYVIGLGLADEKDITVKGLEAVKGSSRVYLESYTSILMVSVDKLEAFYGKKVVVADREMVETEADEMLKGADVDDVAFLVSRVMHLLGEHLLGVVSLWPSLGGQNSLSVHLFELFNDYFVVAIGRRRPVWSNYAL